MLTKAKTAKMGTTPTTGMMATMAMTAERPMTNRPAPLSPRRAAAAISALAGLQILCAAVFIEELLVSVFGLRSSPVSWSWREMLEIFAALGLILGMVMAGLIIRSALRQRQRAVDTLRAASGDFQALVSDQFDAWALTPSERDVALFMLKGFANAEIARLRETSEGTIKAQTTAVFRKAGVTGRPQLLSYFIEELLSDDDSAGRESRDAA
ncbi:MAG: LuxR C-terminal-related transcriptional regulator [Pseudomonadota bacterium]